MTAEIIRNLPAAEYHARPELGGTALKLLHKSAAHYAAQFIDGYGRAVTEALRVGTYTHCATLEHQRWLAEYVRGVEGDGRTTAVKEARRAQAASGKEVVLPDEYDTATNCAAAVRRHKAASFLLRDVDAVELSVFWEDDITGAPCRARFDATRSGVICELKTCADASEEAFGKAVINFGYDIAAAHYWSGYEAAFGKEPSAYVWICVEKEPPYAVATYAATEPMIALGRRKRTTALDRYCDAKATGIWAGYPDRIIELSPPAWAA
jgi:hypothetical protein